MENKNGGLFIRLAAHLQDLLINNIIMFGLLVVFTHNLSELTILPRVINIATYLLVFVLLMAPLQALYSTYFTHKFGGTLGKLSFGLKIVDQESGEFISMKNAFLRTFIGYTFSGKFIGLGFFRIIKSPQKLAWHDDLFNTRVAKEGKTSLGIIIFVVSIVLLGFLMFLNISNVYAFVQGLGIKTF